MVGGRMDRELVGGNGMGRCLGGGREAEPGSDPPATVGRDGGGTWFLGRPELVGGWMERQELGGQELERRHLELT
jgi:hypothetical protein